MWLTASQLSQFDRDGFLAPLEFCSAEEMSVLRPAIDDALSHKPGPYGGDRWSARHQDCRVIFDICSHSAIVDAVSSLIGPDVLIWNSVFFNKEPGGAEIPWHQDRDYLVLEPCISATVWLAIDDVSVANGCLQVIPGSHTEIVPHTPRTDASKYDAIADISDSVKGSAVHVELRAGQFILFHRQLLHYSAPNTSSIRRLGLALRYTVPLAKVKTDTFFEGCRVFIVKGVDTIRQNPIGVPPEV
jgi:ectoine hydroxylase-related dioxygenase (phytanoyl-CoA dioxygenase family)